MPQPTRYSHYVVTFMEFRRVARGEVLTRSALQYVRRPMLRAMPLRWIWLVPPEIVATIDSR